jgi:hypothetical protein
MSGWGQTKKNSLRANVFRVTPESGHRSAHLGCLKGAKTGPDGPAMRLPVYLKQRTSSERQTRTMKRIDSTSSRRPPDPQLPKMPVGTVVDIEPDAAVRVRSSLEIVDD